MSRFALSPRAALVLVGVVLLVALAVVLLGGGGAAGGGAGGAGVTVVSGAPTVAGEPDDAGAGGRGGAGGAGGSGGGAGAGAGAGRGASGAASGPAGIAVVYVVGAVAHPGVVRVPVGERVSDALDAAGGAGGDADLTRLNLARPVVDGERVYVPRVGETEVPAELQPGGAVVGSGAAGGGGPVGAGGVVGGAAGSGVGGTGGVGEDAVVDLNAADTTALETLPGIGPALAQRILAWREEHGGFRSVEDLLEVSGIGDGRFAELRDRVRV